MLDEEFESPEKISRPSGVDVESSRGDGLDGSSQAPYTSERSADRGLVLETYAKVTTTAVASEAQSLNGGNSCSARQTYVDATWEATSQVEGNEKDQVSEGNDDRAIADSPKLGYVAMSENHDRFISVEENFDEDYLEEKDLEATGSISEYNSLTGRDTDDDDSSVLGGSPSKYFQALSKSNSNCDQFFCNSDDEIVFGASDWSEYLHQHGSGTDSFVELQESKKDLQSKLGIGLPPEMCCRDLEGKCIDVKDHENKSDSDLLAEEIPRVRGAGRLDLEDGDEDLTAAERESSATVPLSITTIPTVHSNLGSGISMFGEDENLVDYEDFWDLTSGSQVNPLRVGGHEQVEMQSTEELKILPAQDDMSVDVDVSPCKVTDSDHLSLLAELSVDQISEAEFKSGLRVRAQEDTSVAELAGHTILKIGEDSERIGETSKHEVFQQVSAECHILEDFVPEISVGDHYSNRVRTVDVGSREANKVGELCPFKSLGPGKVGVSASLPERSLEDESIRAGVDWAAEDLGPDELSRYVEALEVKETYIDTVLDMEDVLFDGEGGGGGGGGGRSFQIGKIMSPGPVRPVRDGSLSASTSSALVLASRQVTHPTRLLTDIEWVEIVGAVQRQGGASLGERVVGVKQHTVYRIKVKGGGNEWEIQRRYRDFVVLYSQLQSLFALNKSVSLPPPWEKVKQESRKYFGNTSPDVVELRSALIQVCLQSLIRAGPPLSTATPLRRFLFPVGAASEIRVTSGGPSDKSIVQDQSGSTLPLQEFGLDSPKSDTSSCTEDGTQSSVLGKTIRLIVQIHKKQSLRQQLQAQHYTCAGCYKHLELALGIVPELVQNWGWSGPRLCEYSGQLFCSTCHLNETAVLPAWVLQRWDFTPRLVSQLAKAYLDSIYDKPMLCVSAVNPYLYARVPVLAHLTEMRRKINKMLACIRCPARTRIQMMLGSRRYLLENNDFCALRDLADLSKGAFAVLPGYMRAILLKLSSHITRECFLCRELGESCGAGELCDDEYDVIYPHQDELIIRCPSCQHPFHKSCYRKCQKCPFCRGQPEQIQKDSGLRIEQSGEHESGELGTRVVSSENSTDSLSTSPAAPRENKVSTRRNLLVSFLGSREARSADQEKEIINMNPLSSPIDL